VLTQAILGGAGVDPNNAHYLGVGAGDTFIAAIQQQKIAAGMTTFPTISRLVNSGKGKILVSLLSPKDTEAALGGDYPFIGVFAQNSWVNSNKDVTQRLVNAYVKTLKYIHSHTAAQIADQMPADYYAGDKASYVADLQSQIGIFGTDCKMPAGGPETVQKIQQHFVASYKGKSANLSETYTNEFAEHASV
jgi:NitT/TauT family transport system substrate-binding protein